MFCEAIILFSLFWFNSAISGNFCCSPAGRLNIAGLEVTKIWLGNFSAVTISFSSREAIIISSRITPSTHGSCSPFDDLKTPLDTRLKRSSKGSWGLEISFNSTSVNNPLSPLPSLATLPGRVA